MIKYGSLRNYKKHLRATKDFHNPSEQKFKKLLEERGINYIRSGYPDFIILDAGGNIFGFVEVKPNKKSRLRYNQQRFASFCAEHNIPFLMWVDGEELPVWASKRICG